MNSDNQDQSSSQPAPAQSSIPTLIQVMKKVETKSPEAQLNESSMSDGKGGRIEFNDQVIGSKSISDMGEF